MNENKKISQLEIATESKNTDIIPIVQDGTNKQVTKEVLLGDTYNKSAVDAKLGTKADKATTLKGYGIADAYTKEEAGKIFITKAVNDLVNYYLKSETYSKEEVNALVDTIPKFAITVVSALPTKDISTTTIYLVKTDDEGNDIFTEYIYANGKWEILGSQKIDITNYYTKEEINKLFDEYIVFGEENVTDNTILILDDDELGNIGSEVYIGPTEPATKQKIWFRKGKNIFNINGPLTRYFITADGRRTLDNTNIYVYKIINNPKNKYAVSFSERVDAAWVRFCFYNNSDFISRTIVGESGTIVEVPEGTTKIDIRVDVGENKYLKDLQIEEEKVTSYEPYVEQKIFILGRDNKYREFGEEPNENIITNMDPIKTGRKVDGKDEYVIRVDCGPLPNGEETRKDIITCIPKTATITKASATAVNDGNNTLIIPYLQSTFIAFAVVTNSTTTDVYYCARFDVSPGVDRSVYNGYAEIYFTY